MKIRLFVIGLYCCLGFGVQGYAQLSNYAAPTKGLPYFTTYTPTDYPGEQQNRWVMQWKNGSMLVANSGGLLQHSDRDWRLFGDDDIKYISSLKQSSIDSSVIWAGSFSNIGYFTENDSTYLSYQSLTEKLDENRKDFSAVSAIEEFRGEVYFLSDLYLFSYNVSDDTVRLPQEIYNHLNGRQTQITHITQWHEKLHIFTDDGSIITMDGSGNTTRAEYSGVQFAKVVDTENLGENLLLGDLDKGLLYFNGTSVVPFETPVLTYLKKHTIVDLLCLRNGDIAVATDYGGTMILNSDGRLKYLLSSDTGLRENVHNHLHEDEAGDLWIAGNESITKVFTGVPVRHLNGAVFGFNDALQFAHYKDKFYVGSLDGLYRLDYPLHKIHEYSAGELFTEISPEPAPFWDFEEVDGKLWIGASSGLYELADDELSLLFPLETSYIRRMSENMILIVTSNGVNLLQKKENKWIDAGKLDVANFFIYILEVMDERTFWVGGVQGQLVKVTFDEETATFSQKYYTESEGVFPSDLYEPTIQNGKLIVSSNGGLMIYDETHDRFEPFTEMNSELEGWNAVVKLDESGNYWSINITSDYRGVVKMEPQPDGQLKRTYTTFEISTDHFGDFLEIDGRHLWVGSTQSIMYRDLFEPFNSSTPEAYIWQVKSNFDQEILSLDTPTKAIPFPQRNIGIHLASTSHRYPEKNQYRYKIDDGDWSEWRAEAEINFNEPLPGNYDFTVQTRDFLRQVSTPVSYTIEIAAPWYLSNLAYTLYFLMIGAGMFSMVRGFSNYRIQRQLDQLKLMEAEKMFELDAMKDRLFANISHEFRTPLTISHGLVKKMIQQVSDEGELGIEKRDLYVVNRNMIRLKDMVDQIIDLTKADQDYLTLKQNYYPADKLSTLSVESFRSLAEYHGHHFEYIDKSEGAVLFVDRSKVEIMINNLISNAIKFTPNGGKIVIKSGMQDKSFVLTITDTGSGIPPGDEEVIFERFHRIERKDEEYVEGMGVGLELSRTLARLHGGDIVVLPGQKQGATFMLTLPMVEIDDTTPIIKLEDFETDNTLAKEPDIQEDKLARLHRQTRQILLVEDNDDMRDYVEGILSELGHVTTTANGLEALSIIQQGQPDLIITDLMMPQMDGKTFVKKLSEHEQWKQIPVIVLTAKAMDKDKIDLLRIGVVDYIIKPFEPEQLVLKSRNLLNYYQRRLNELAATPETDEINIIRQLVKYVQDHISDTNLSVDQMVHAFPQSRRSLYRNISKDTGMTPSEFIREVRLTTARELVNKDNNYRIEELADAVGYKSATSFRKVYEKRFGEHPLD